VPIAGRLLLHVPGPTKSVKVSEEPTHRLGVPATIPPGNGFTVTTTPGEVQPDPIEKVMIAVPGLEPVTTPVIASTGATVGLELYHVPGPPASTNVVVCPWHTLSVPVGAGGGFTTVTSFVTLHDVAGTVYIIVVDPTATPVTTPVEEILPMPGALLLQTPPGLASVSVIVEPTHTLLDPPIGNGFAFTVTTVVVEQPVVPVSE